MAETPRTERSACRLAALVASPDEARRALEAGADYVLAPARRERSNLGVPERVQPSQDQLLFAVAADETLPAEPRRVQLVPAPTDPAPYARDGFGALLLDPGRPLLRVFSLEVLAAQIERCRAAGIECWLGGALELPDVPRLAVLKPDAVVVEGFEPSAIAAALSMLAPQAVGTSNAPTDIIRMTNFVLQTRVGAYGFERERQQRVRFSVEAGVVRPARHARAVGDVYSYDLIMDAVRRLCERGHTDLVETLAEELADELLSDPRLREVMVRVEKLDLGPEAVGIEIRRARAG